MTQKWKEKFPVKCFIVRISLPILIGLCILFTTLGVALFFAVVLNDTYFSFSYRIDTVLAAQFGAFFQGLVGTIFGTAGAFFLR
ncbi:MAG: hypothetical protein HC888_06480 [Candidatus Competibacteraceae bacterium]|nr:hypothetical protein [Candidatus Competibacteraceae bacterium]